MFYLASPYSHPDPAIRQHRFEVACEAAVKLIRMGHVVFSPIAHSHTMHLAGLPGDWEFWKRQDEWFVSHCERLVVLTIDGWKESRGVAAEIEIAKREWNRKRINWWDGVDTAQFENSKLYKAVGLNFGY
jgi:hypothetical protein